METSPLKRWTTLERREWPGTRCWLSVRTDAVTRQLTCPHAPLRSPLRKRKHELVSSSDFADLAEAGPRLAKVARESEPEQVPRVDEPALHAERARDLAAEVNGLMQVLAELEASVVEAEKQVRMSTGVAAVVPGPRGLASAGGRIRGLTSGICWIACPD